MYRQKLWVWISETVVMICKGDECFRRVLEKGLVNREFPQSIPVWYCRCLKNETKFAEVFMKHRGHHQDIVFAINIPQVKTKV